MPRRNKTIKYTKKYNNYGAESTKTPFKSQQMALLAIKDIQKYDTTLKLFTYQSGDSGLWYLTKIDPKKRM